MIYFLEASIRFISNSGIITFITSNGWLNNEYGHKFQKFLLAQTSVVSIVDTDFKYFENANINTAITFFKGKRATANEICFITHHRPFADAEIGIEFGRCDIEELRVTRKRNDGNNSLKWGAYFSADSQFFELLEVLKTNGKTLAQVGFTIGQGLNLSDRDSHIIRKLDIGQLNLTDDNVIPFMNREETGKFNWQTCNNYIIDKASLNNNQIADLCNSNIKLFDSTMTRKDRPKLIMPRGIGEKHFCTYNTIKGYSDSGVDIYGTVNTSEDDLLRIWLFCNSTVCWLMREKFGRKNLGGGMLKAEAIDLKEKPLYYRFSEIDKIKHIFDEASARRTMNCLDELEEDLHKEIDEIVFNHLQISLDARRYVVDTFRNTVMARTQKSKRKI